MKNEYHLVQMNLRPHTFKLLEELKDRLYSANRSDTVRKALQIADIVSKTIKQGGKIFIEDADGTKSKMMLPELG